MNELWIICALAFASAVLAIDCVFSLLFKSRTYRRTIDRRLALTGNSSAKRQLFDVLRQERGLVDLDNAAFAGLNEFLIQTGLGFSKLALALWTFGTAIVIAAALSLLTSRLWLAASGGLILAPLIVAMYLTIVRRRRIERFTAQLPNALDIIVRSLRVGHPFTTAMELVARESPDPVGAELALTADEISFGQDVTTAVANLHRRVGQDDLLFLVIAVSVQSQTGGNLAEVLARLTSLMRERAALQLKVSAVSAEGRLSAWFLSAMPFVLFGAIRLLSRGYFDEVTASPILAPALIYGSASLIVSNFIIYRMVHFKI